MVTILILGLVTDGEFNSLRTQGVKRAVSIIQVLMDSKTESRRTTVQQIVKFLKPVHKGTIYLQFQKIFCIDTHIFHLLMYKILSKDGVLVTEAHPAIPREDIEWLAEYMAETGRTFNKAIHILHRKLFPLFYDPYPWKPGEYGSQSCGFPFLHISSFFSTLFLKVKHRRMGTV